jgi:hypothetical protein
LSPAFEAFINQLFQDVGIGSVIPPPVIGKLVKVGGFVIWVVVDITRSDIKVIGTEPLCTESA